MVVVHRTQVGVAGRESETQRFWVSSDLRLRHAAMVPGTVTGEVSMAEGPTC